MFKDVRISLANKCQLLFGAAVILILIAALAVVWARMKTLVQRPPVTYARTLAEACLNGHVPMPRAATSLVTAASPLKQNENLSITFIPASLFGRATKHQPFLEHALKTFQDHADLTECYQRDASAGVPTFYRYARAIRSHSRHAGNPLIGLLLIHLRDPDAATQQMLNRIYIVAAGLAAGLLAIGVFWFITTRIILSPVRLLRDYAQRVSEGNTNIRSDINTGDEFEQLSNMFNAMLENLKHNEDQLRSINKSLDLKLGKLAESNVALYEANKMKGEFLANVSHELRTPLNSIVGFAEVLQESLPAESDPANDKRRRYVNHILGSSRRLLDLITELLDLAKIEAGRMEVHAAPLSVADTVEGLINLMRPQANQKAIDLAMKIEPNLPVVETDAGKLQQILFNFLANAVKFTPRQGTVTLSAAYLPGPNSDQPGRMRFSVSDTGPGIALEDQHRIFEKFTQLASTATREQGGTGLGLTISRELAQMLQGEVQLDSEPGAGATFSVIIPLVYRETATPLMPDAASEPN